MSLRIVAGACLAACAVIPRPVEAQVTARVVVQGLTAPVAFVQDPSNPLLQYVVEQGGRIRVVQSGALLAADFLDLSAVITTAGERGLLGLAFPPDYAASGRFYVNFTDANGDTVVARFKRSPNDPLVADPASRFDLSWSTGERVIRQPFANHNGGNLEFGPDGNLYVGMGDGGSADDPGNRAQDPTTLLGKMLRIDVNVPDTDVKGFRVPADNPFLGGQPVAALPEIWDLGLRNPWRFSFDAPSLGGTGALVIGDVGQASWEEIDYEPPQAHGGRNYGWRVREGMHPHILTLPPAFVPLTDPIFEYDHTVGQAVIGGVVYRGRALGAAFSGRYFYADLNGRVWSLGLGIDSTTGNATVVDQQEHTAALGGSLVLGSVVSFGVDADGEVYLVSASNGTILRIESGAPTLTVAASPGPAATVLVSPADLNGAGFGTTGFSRTYAAGTVVTLNAFPQDANQRPFVKWQKDGTDYAATAVAQVVVDRNVTLTAVYQGAAPAPSPAPTPASMILTVASATGVGATVLVSPADMNGAGFGTTAFSRAYGAGTAVTLNAFPQDANQQPFVKWQKDGADYAATPVAQVIVDRNVTMTAVYQGAAVTPGPTPAPGPTPPPAPPPPASSTTLTVTSTPGAAATVLVSPADLNGAGFGSTTFSRSFSAGTAVTLNAFPQDASQRRFVKWQKDGVDYTLSAVAQVLVDRPVTMVAVYEGPAPSPAPAPGTNTTLTVVSATGVGATVLVSPSDVNGAGFGTTGFTRTYSRGTVVTLNAFPQDASQQRFVKWQKDGVDYATTPVIEVVMDADTTVAAIYQAPSP